MVVKLILSSFVLRVFVSCVGKVETRQRKVLGRLKGEGRAGKGMFPHRVVQAAKILGVSVLTQLLIALWL